MSNKIDGYTLPAVSPQAPMRTAPAGSASRSGQPAGPVGAVAGPDRVALTADAQSLHRLEQTIAALPSVDSERVEKIRAQLRDGTYVINPQAIADQLARMEWELAR